MRALSTLLARPAVGLACALAACTGGPSPPAPPAASAPAPGPGGKVPPVAQAPAPPGAPLDAPPEPDVPDASTGVTWEERARAAGLSDADAVALGTMAGVPVLIPSYVGEGFRPDPAFADVSEGGPTYGLTYRHPDGRCYALNGATEGFGGPELPAERVPVTVAALGAAVTLHRASRDPASEEAQAYGGGALVSDFVPAGAMRVTFSSADDEGCNVVAFEEAARIVAGLRPLDPAHDAR